MSVILALQMSISIPICFKPVVYNDKLYIDGATIDNLPWRFVHNQQKAIALSVRSNPRKKNMHLFDYIESLLEQCKYELDNRIIQNNQNKICIIHVCIYSNSWLLGYHPAEIKEFINTGESTFIKFKEQYY